MKPRPEIIGVINLSPESNVPGSHATTLDEVSSRATELLNQGATYVELGARSISHDKMPVSENEEWCRLRPALETLVADKYKVVIDTWSESCAKKALAFGASIVNFTGRMPSIELCRDVARANADLCALYLPYPDPYSMRTCIPIKYGKKMIVKYFHKVLSHARRARLNNLILDPNMGIFHPEINTETKIAYQIQAIATLPHLSSLGYPTLAYLARKKEITSRMLIAAHLATMNVNYIRAHEPKLAIRAWDLQTSLLTTNNE